MSREMILCKVARVADGVVFQDVDRYACGRTEFTAGLCGLFVGDEAELAVIDDGTVDDGFKEALRTREAKSADGSLALRAVAVPESELYAVMEENRDADEREIDRCVSMMDDAKSARARSKDIGTFESFTNLIDELAEHIRNYRYEADAFEDDYVKTKGECGIGEHVGIIWSE